MPRSKELKRMLGDVDRATRAADFAVKTPRPARPAELWLVVKLFRPYFLFVGTITARQLHQETKAVLNHLS